MRRRRPWVVRNAGRILLTAADLLTVVGPLSADWNRSHVFNPTGRLTLASTAWSAL